LAAVGDGAYKNIQSACKATIEIAEKTGADRKAVNKYNELFPVYQKLYGDLKDSMHRLAEIQG
jgi:xylulokinase